MGCERSLIFVKCDKRFPAERGKWVVMKSEIHAKQYLKERAYYASHLCGRILNSQKSCGDKRDQYRSDYENAHGRASH